MATTDKSNEPDQGLMLTELRKLEPEQVNKLFNHLKENSVYYQSELLRWIRLIRFDATQQLIQLVELLSSPQTETQFQLDFQTVLGHISPLTQAKLYPQYSTKSDDVSPVGTDDVPYHEYPTEAPIRTSGENLPSIVFDDGSAIDTSVILSVRDPIPPKRERLIGPDNMTDDYDSDRFDMPPAHLLDPRSRNIYQMVNKLLKLDIYLVNQAMLLAAEYGVLDLGRVCQITENMISNRQATLVAYISEIYDQPGLLQILEEQFLILEADISLRPDSINPGDFDSSTLSSSSQSDSDRLDLSPTEQEAIQILTPQLDQSDRVYLGHWLGLSLGQMLPLLSQPLEDLLPDRVTMIRALDALKSRQGVTHYLQRAAQLLGVSLGFDERLGSGRNSMSSISSSFSSALATPDSGPILPPPSSPLVSPIPTGYRLAPTSHTDGTSLRVPQLAAIRGSGPASPVLAPRSPHIRRVRNTRVSSASPQKRPGPLLPVRGHRQRRRGPP